MKRLILAFAPFTLIACAPALLAEQNETERITRSVAIDPGGTLRLKSFSGRVDISAYDGREVTIEAIRRAPRERLDRIRLDVHGGGSTVYIDANRRDASSFWDRHNNVVETDFAIRVPRSTNLDVHVFSAGVAVTGVEGTHRIGGFSSRIRLEDVVGSIKAHTFSGSVDIRTKGWRDDNVVDVDTFSGDVSLRLPESAHGTVTFNSFSGHLNSDLPLTLRTGSRRSLKADLGGPGGGSLKFKTFSGSVRIDR